MATRVSLSDMMLVSPVLLNLVYASSAKLCSYFKFALSRVQVVGLFRLDCGSTELSDVELSRDERTVYG